MVGGLIVGLVGGLTVGLIGGLTVGLISGRQQGLEMRSRPNQSSWNSLQSMIRTTLFAYPGAVILVYFVYFLKTIANEISKGQNWDIIIETLWNIETVWKNLPDSLTSGASGALFLGFIVGGVALIQQFCLRLILVSSHSVPWRYVRFLNYCVERHLLQRVGDRYRFLHRELLEHFARKP
ncbi:MAG: hypothetical protein HC781_20460 [Leptolyngbyaceae cyanobacterium CSU_1_4]|nr:hypothetical protein [Leptolyngbyaceae cyanobacterium CSU_1_4]